MRRVLAALVLATLAIGCAGPGSESSPEPSVADSTPPDSKKASAGSSATDSALLRVAVIGDFGTGFETQYRLAERMCFWREMHPFDLVVTTGDNIYDAGDPGDFESKFFRPYDCLFDAGVRWHAVLGNHDVGTNDGRPEIDELAFGMEGRNYVVRRDGVRFVMWDSNSDNRRWLRRHVGEEPGDRWTIVSFHHPVFSPGEHGSTPGYRPALPRLFARKGVDLVLNGHDHLYARMRPKRKVLYVVTGGGGARLYDCVEPDVAKICIERNHFLYVVVGAERLNVRAVPISGGAFDYFRTRGRS